MNAFDIAASGMAAHRAEMDLIAQNIASAGAIGAHGARYRERRAVLEPAGGDSFASALTDASFGFADLTEAQPDEDPAQGVRFAGYVEGGPSAPDVDPIEQMVSLVSAGRAYDADVAALQAAKQMDVEAIEVDRT